MEMSWKMSRPGRYRVRAQSSQGEIQENEMSTEGQMLSFTFALPYNTETSVEMMRVGS
jgi:hypothetical protein